MNELKNHFHGFENANDLIRVWQKDEFADMYGLTWKTLKKRFKEFDIDDGGRNKTLSPLQVTKFFKQYGIPGVIE